jgi:FixJ family two-component response regulator
MRTETPTVFVVDDDPSVRKALARAMATAGLNAKTFASAREFLEQGPPAGPACLVLDVRMPDLGGLDLQAELNSRSVELPVIFITGHGDIPVAVKAMKGGAVDFLGKPFRVEKLLGIVQEVLQREDRLRGVRAERAEIQGRIGTLSPREREVMGLVVQGLLSKQIADELGAAEATVKVHRARLMKKMQVRTVAELVRAVGKVNGVEGQPTAL